MNYRLFQPDDFDDLYAIEEICFQPPQRFTRRYMRQLVRVADAATWIAEQDRTMAGFAIVEWSQQITGIVAYIATIEVLPEHRGQGTAQNSCAVSKALLTRNAPVKSGSTSTLKMRPPSASTSAADIASRAAPTTITPAIDPPPSISRTLV